MRETAARRTLARLDSPVLNAKQRQFLARPSIKQLRSMLRSWAISPVDLEQLLSNFEQFELNGGEELAQQIADSVVAAC